MDGLGVHGTSEWSGWEPRVSQGAKAARLLRSTPQPMVGAGPATSAQSESVDGRATTVEVGQPKWPRGRLVRVSQSCME